MPAIKRQYNWRLVTGIVIQSPKSGYWVARDMGKIKVLIADANENVRAGTRRILEREDDLEVVAEAHDGEEAVALTHNYSPDVAIVGIVMDKLNGIEATRQIKSFCSTTAVLILTALDDVEFVISSLEAGASGYLLKNVRSHELVAAVRAACATDSAPSTSVLWKVLDRSVDASVPQGK